MTATKIVSIGKACSLIQLTPQRIRQAAEALHVLPAIRINGVDHFDEADLERLAEYARRRLARGTEP